MFKKIVLLFTAFIMILSVKADEGMWLPLHIKRLNEVDMQKMGLKLTAEEIYSVNNSSLKDAVVSLGGFCTGEIISGEGLLLTNHHCGFDAIQTHSSVKNDYLTDGFWAMSKDKELPNEGLSASFLVRMENVTEAVLKELNNTMNEAERKLAIQKVTSELKKNAIGDTHYTAEVKSFFEGNEFYLFIYEIFNDIRLVGAPPSSIGKFGGDTDNWMWPRHTGDFSLFRVYMSPDGKPAAYAAENVPYKPKHFLPISLKGIKESDFSMIMGYPGSTDRYLTSHGVKLAIEKDQPARVKIREKRLDLMKEDMDKSVETRIKYASKHAQVSNYYKYFKGQIEGLKRLNVYDKKKQIENEFSAWIAKDPALTEKYGNVLTDMIAAYQQIEKFKLTQVYLGEAVFGSEILAFSWQFNGLNAQLGKKDADEKAIQETITGLREAAKDHFKDYNAATDKKITAALLQMYYNDIPKEQHADIFRTIEKKYKGDFVRFTEDMFSKSIFADAARLENFLDKPSAKTLEKDPALKTMMSVIADYRLKIAAEMSKADDQLNKANRLFVEGLRAMQNDKKFYPDANFSLRLTYGKVGDYYPRDAVYYNYFSTLDGIIEKEDSTNEEFIVPPKLKELYQKKDYGRYADKSGKLNVCFISNNDITGGNSGSPVINGEGHLIGCAFDGNWEAMSGDIAFEPDYQRTISVDIRYILFIIDKYAGATHLVNEMKIIQN